MGHEALHALNHALAGPDHPTGTTSPAAPTRSDADSRGSRSLAQFPWRTRIVVGTLAVVLEAQAGRWPSPVVIAVFLSLTFVLPITRRTWERQLTLQAGRVSA